MKRAAGSSILVAVFCLPLRVTAEAQQPGRNPPDRVSGREQGFWYSGARGGFPTGAEQEAWVYRRKKHYD